jgi:hypothetical protein
MTGEPARLAAVVDAIDAVNGADPNVVMHAGIEAPRALAEGRIAHAWVERLRDDAPELLLIAARGHHIRRWEHPRSSHPKGRDGYLAWRSALYEVHADHLDELMRDAGYGAPEIEAMRRIVRKRGIKTDPDAQTYEDAVTLAFLETQFAPFAARTGREQVVRALRRTWRKLSDDGRAAALTLPLTPELQALVEEAITAPTLRREGDE